jgi:peptidoglycan hydrolase-like protein with peptidoglycan-binding domain
LIRHFLAAVLIAAGLALGAPAAHAGFEESRDWFESLSADERTATQANLTLLGYYEYLVDGQFGNGTFAALTAFQRSLGRASTGVLIPPDQEKLVLLAAEVYAGLGMDLVRDREGQAALIMPLGLLTVKHQIGRGNAYATPDGGLALETLRRPIGEKPFGELYEELKTEAGGRRVTYSNYNDDRFVIAGQQAGRSFYTMFQNADTDSVGYSLSWTADYEDPARMLAIFIASHFTALRYLPGEQPDAKLAHARAVSRQFGVFSLPVGAPDVIILNGEIDHALNGDFALALEARPDARILLLNSPGGYVDNALQVAREVRRRGMSTLVAPGMGCYSACAYIFFAGQNRTVEGELGVHQISAEVADLVLAQTTLSDVLDALDQFGVEQTIISVMLRTPPESMYVFSSAEIAGLGINRGEPVLIADLSRISVEAGLADGDVQVNPAVIAEPGDIGVPGVAFVELARQGSEEQANRSLEYALHRFGGVLGDAQPEIHREETESGPLFRIRVPALSVENANALCAAIQSAGGGCFVSNS